MKCKNGNAVWGKAKKLIPGGTQLLSKRSEMFLPEQWPSYYKNAKGVMIEDLDGNKLIDMSIMGVGSCILGYSDDDVNNAVKDVIDNGSMCTLNAVEDVILAEMLVDIHPWASQVRYVRTGGEAMAVAVRIGRAYSGKDTVAFCGYHGWHDWYIACNIADDKNLDGHLLSGLQPAGIPRHLYQTSLPFEYNNLNQLREIVDHHDVGVIVLEPYRHQEPEDGFIDEVREIAKQTRAVLIFDEITCGWRNNIGGIHLEWGMNPDIVVYAKAISNGYPMGVILGTADVMEAAQRTFISSTYWTERIGPAAAIATICKMTQNNVPAHISKIGDMIGKGWERLACQHGLNIDILGPNSLITFVLNHEPTLSLKTLFTQEMLKRGYLASQSVYVSYAHTQQIVNQYLEKVDEVFGILKKAIDHDEIDQILEGPVAHSDFQRLT